MGHLGRTSGASSQSNLIAAQSAIDERLISSGNWPAIRFERERERERSLKRRPNRKWRGETELAHFSLCSISLSAARKWKLIQL